MARKTNKLPLGENGRIQLHLNASKLETLKNISASAFACAVYGASINRDTNSLEEVARYLVGVRDGVANNALADGKSLMDREYPVSAYGLSDAGKVTELKDKGYIFAMLFSPLANRTQEQFSGDKDLQEYAQLLAGMVKMLKIGARPVAAGVYKMGMSNVVDVPLQEVIKPLLECLSEPLPLLNIVWQLSNAYKSWRHDSTPKDLRIERANAVLRLALQSENFCNGAVKIFNKDSAGVNEVAQPNFQLLATVPGTAWPTHAEMRRVMEHLEAMYAVQEVVKAYLYTGDPRAEKLMAPCYPDLRDPHSGDKVSTTTYLQQYGQIEGPVHHGVSLAVKQNGYEPTAEAWPFLEPVQQRISREGGRGIWPNLFLTDSDLNVEFLMDVVQKYAAKDPEGAVQALMYCAYSGAHVHKGVIRYPRVVAALIAAGADIRSRGPDSHLSFAEFIAQSPRNGSLLDHPEILAAIQAQEARAALKGVDAMAEVDAPGNKRKAALKF